MALDLPALPYDPWEETRKTLHLMVQIVGKARMTLHPKLNHWWHVTLYPSARGITTGRIPVETPDGIRDIEIAFDFIDHRLALNDCNGTVETVPLTGISIADFFKSTMDGLQRFGIRPDILAKPYDWKYGDPIPFADDKTHAAYDADAVHRYWRALSGVAAVFEMFRGRFVGKATPVQLFWHSFDLAYTRFSGRKAPPMEGGTHADKEAYSHEVISFGWWPGDPEVREPAFYSYTAPDPGGLDTMPLEPAAARWNVTDGSAMAFLSYESLQQSSDPERDLLAFLQSAYDAGTEKAGWDRDAFRHDYAET